MLAAFGDIGNNAGIEDVVVGPVNLEAIDGKGAFNCGYGIVCRGLGLERRIGMWSFGKLVALAEIRGVYLLIFCV